jgi:hypothetical protein
MLSGLFDGGANVDKQLILAPQVTTHIKDMLDEHVVGRAEPRAVQVHIGVAINPLEDEQGVVVGMSRGIEAPPHPNVAPFQVAHLEHVQPHKGVVKEAGSLEVQFEVAWDGCRQYPKPGSLHIGSGSEFPISSGVGQRPHTVQVNARIPFQEIHDTGSRKDRCPFRL